VKLKQIAMEIGLHINISKTKAMIMSHYEENTDQVNDTFQNNFKKNFYSNCTVQNISAYFLAIIR
jgi:hypothetical protein